jgi:hypothetical protein
VTNAVTVPSLLVRTKREGEGSRVFLKFPAELSGYEKVLYLRIYPPGMNLGTPSSSSSGTATYAPDAPQPIRLIVRP